MENRPPNSLELELELERTRTARLRALRRLDVLGRTPQPPARLLRAALDLVQVGTGLAEVWGTLGGDEGELEVIGSDSEDARLAEVEARLAAGGSLACVQEPLTMPGQVLLRSPRTECPDCPLAPGYPEDHACLVAALPSRRGPRGTICARCPTARARAPETTDWFAEVAADLGAALERADRELRLGRQGTVLDAIRDYVTLTDLEGRVLHMNRSAMAALGRTADELYGQPVQTFGDAQTQRQIIERTRRDGSWSGLIRNLSVSGQEVVLDCHTWRVDDSDIGPAMLCGVARDVTERHEAEARARRQSEMLERLSARVPGCLFQCIVPPEGPGHITFVSPGITDVYDVEPEDAQDDLRLVFRRIHLDDKARVLEGLRRAVEQVTPLRVEHRIAPRGGSEEVRWAQIDAVPERLADGSMLWHGYVQDVTERVELETRLRQAQKMEAVGHLAGGIAHDFNNLLLAISGNAELARTLVEGDDELTEHLDEIAEATDRAAGVTRQLLVFSRRQPLEPRPLDVNEVVRGLLKLMRRTLGEHVELLFTPGADTKTVLADPGQVEQILLNLCVNARDAMPDGGSLHIHTRNRAFTDHELRLAPWAQRGAHVELSVTDDGVGMDAHTKSKIFEPFFTTKEVGRGTGLGLATVFGIVQQHRGHIEVDSAPGVGTTFRVTLPATDDAVIPTAAPERVRPRTGNETILLAEDEARVRRLTRRVLERAGYRVIVAKDGAEALARVDEHAKEIDLALLDLVMPRAGGGQVASHLATVRPAVPVLFTTGYELSVEFEPAAWGVERSRLIRKPYAADELLSAVRGCLDA